MNIHNIIVHHTSGTDAQPLADSSNYTVLQCNEDHRIRFNMLSSLHWYVGYHYFIDKNGVVTQTRIDTEEGAHCIGYNNAPGDSADKASIGICLAGNFDATLPTTAQISALTTLLNAKVKQYGILPANIVPHRAHAVKTCYGMKLPDNWAANLIGTTSSHVITAPILQVVALGDKGPSVSVIQNYLINHGYTQNVYEIGVYDVNMAKNVLAFQIKNNVSDEFELGSLRGERVGIKTLAAMK